MQGSDGGLQTFNEEVFPCSPQVAFAHACQVDRWPQVLPHYRWVRFHQGGPQEGGLVEMAARREFGRLGWPVWWLSRMWVDPERLTVRYAHIDGVTRGMQVLWQIEPAGTSSRVSIIHQWEEGPSFAGPAAPWIGRQVIGPVFVHFVASQTLHHLAQHVQREMVG